MMGYVHRSRICGTATVLLCALSCASVSTATKGSKKPPPTILLLNDVRNYGSPRAGHVGMAGIATNKSRQPLRNTMAVIVHSDDTGRIIEQRSLLAFRLLKPNAPQKFNVKVDLSPGERTGKYLIGFGLEGGAALDVQVRKAMKRE